MNKFYHWKLGRKNAGPLVTMMGKMVKNMIYFVVLLLVVLLSFGVSRQSILYPNEEASWRLIRDVSILFVHFYTHLDDEIPFLNSNQCFIPLFFLINDHWCLRINRCIFNHILCCTVKCLRAKLIHRAVSTVIHRV